jgi:hypothetical protein
VEEGYARQLNSRGRQIANYYSGAKVKTHFRPDFEPTLSVCLGVKRGNTYL